MELYTGGLPRNFPMLLYKLNDVNCLYNFQLGLGNWVENGDI